MCSASVFPALAAAAWRSGCSACSASEPGGIAWYIFAAMGFYPVNPVSGDYMIGSPPFTKRTLTLQGGRRLVISAPRNSPNNLYIQSARLNGKPIDIPIVTYQQIEAGGLLEFDMGPTSSSWVRLERHPTSTWQVSSG